MKNKYAIDANWWRQWCDFVNIEFQNQSKLVELLYSDISHKVKDDINAPKGDVDPADFATNLHNNEFENCINSDRIFDGNTKQTSRPDSVCGSIAESIEDIYKRPGKITNSHLAVETENGKYRLNDCLCESYDYVLVNTEAWDYLKRWYEFDIEVILETKDYEN